MVSVFLYAPQDFRNLCVLARTLEVFGYSSCHVFDPYRLVRERYGKARTRELRSVSAGAFQKIQWQRVEDPKAFLDAHRGRVVATVADSAAVPVAEHSFAANAMLAFGSESSGLPPEIAAASAARITISGRGQTQSLNLAVALGIVLFEVDRQRTAAGSTRLPA